MLFDKEKNYRIISEDTFNNELVNFKENSNIVGVIHYFYKDKNGNIIHKERKTNRKILLQEDLELIVKYYTIEIKIDEPMCFDYEDIGMTYKIYNLGTFYISSLFKMKTEKSNEIKSMFENYDKNYKSMTFPWTDEEFIMKYIKRNV